MRLFGGGDEFLKKSEFNSTRVGLNLIKGSALDNTSQSSWATSETRANWSDHLVLLQNDLLQDIYVTPNTTYTFSFILNWLDTTASDTGFYFVEKKDNSTLTAPYKDNKYTFATGKLENVAGLHTFSFTTGAECNLLEMHIRYIGSNPNGFQLRKVKLEKGDAATTWCPAIQDYAMKSDILVSLLNGQNRTYVDDSFDLNSADIGVYRSWGKTPKNAPNGITAWCLYMVGYFSETEGSKFEFALDTDANIYYRVLSGSPLSWRLWQKITATVAK